ncbi:MAG: hypothetical protein RI957_557 [Verrucomicrobiota bacterium]|jgi:hypothetical protein
MEKMRVEVVKYRKPDGYATRYWAVLLNGDLLVVTLYRKGALAVAAALTGSMEARPVLTRDRQDAPSPVPIPHPEA